MVHGLERRNRALALLIAFVTTPAMFRSLAWRHSQLAVCILAGEHRRWCPFCFESRASSIVDDVSFKESGVGAGDDGSKGGLWFLQLARVKTVPSRGNCAQRVHGA